MTKCLKFANIETLVSKVDFALVSTQDPLLTVASTPERSVILAFSKWPNS